MSLLLIVLIIGVVFLASIATGYRSSRRGPLSPLTRTICGSLAAALFAIVSFQTLSDLRGCSLLGSPPMTVTVPTKPAPPIRVDARNRSAQTDPQKLLIHWLVVEDSLGDQRVIQVKTQTLLWPEDKGKTLSTDLKWDGENIDASLAIKGVVSNYERAEGSSNYVFEGRFHGDMKTRSRRSSSETGVSCGNDGVFATHVVGSRVDRRAMSLVRSTETTGLIVCLLDRASLDDPFAQRDVLSRLEDARKSVEQTTDRFYQYRSDDASQPAAIRWFTHFGMGGLALIAAGVLLSLVFPMRQVAFVACIAVAVLATVGLDRLVSSRLVRAMQEKGAVSDTRRAAMAWRLMGATFFCQETAYRTVQSAIADQGSSTEFKRLLVGEISFDLMAKVKEWRPIEWKSIELVSRASPGAPEKRHAIDFMTGTWSTNDFGFDGGHLSLEGFSALRLSSQSSESHAALVAPGFPANKRVPLRGDWTQWVNRPQVGDQYVIRVAGRQQNGEVDPNRFFVLVRFTDVGDYAVRFDWARLE